MPLYRIQAPNGQTYEIEGPEGASQQQVINAVLAQHPDAGQAPKDTTGIFERGARGLESLLASQRTALESVAGGDYAQKALERQQRISEKYPGQSDWEAVKGKYEKEGLLPAVGEYLSRIPGAVSEQLPQIGESMAGARLGSLAGPFGTVAGLVAPSYTQAYGTLLEREAEEQRKRGETVDPSRLQAAALAVPYSAIDTITTLIPMGKGIVKSLFGEEVSKLLFKGATKEAEAAAAKKLAEEGLPKTIGKGLFKGAAFEIPGEVSQQVIERFQAGLPLLDDDALKEYGETAFSTSMLAPIGAAGRLSERSGARNLIEQQRQEEDAKQRLAQAKAEEERRNSPEYIKEFVSAYEDAQEQFSAMKATVKKPGKDALPADHAQYREDKAAMDELGKSLYAGSSEYKRVKPLHDKLVEDERYNAMTPEERLMESLGIKQAAPAETEAEEQQAPQYTIDENGRVVEVSKQKETPKLSPEQAYAEKQLQQATDFGQLMLDDKVSWLMQNPAMAKLLVDNNVQIPGVSPQENKTILSVLRLQLKDAEKQRKVAATERGETETEQLQAQLPGMEEAPSTAFDELVNFAQESKEQAGEELRHLDDTFVAGLSRPDTGALTVSMNPVGGSAKKPAQIRDRVDAAFQEADKADEEYFSARAARQPDAALAAKKRATDAVQKLNALAETGSDYAKELVKLRRAQIAAWGRLTAAMDDLRADHTLDSQDPEKRKLAASTRGTLQKQIARARADLITSILQEAATNRRASWQQLSKEEAIQGADRIRGLIDSWTERAATTPQRAEYEDVEIPAQMRADKIVQPARIERRLVRSPVYGMSNRENLHFINSIRGATKDILAVPTAKVTKETPELKQQFASVEKKRVEEERGETKAGKPGELTRLREYVGNKLTKALGKTNLDDDLRSDLEAAQDIIEDGKASRNLLDIVDHIAERINTGRTEGLKTKFEKDPTKPGRVREVQYIGETAQNVQELKDALRLSRGVAEDTSGQRQLDLLVEEPGQRPRLVEKDLGYIRMTPENFANSPKVKAARDAVDKLRVLLKRTDAKKKREQEQKQKLQAASAQLQDAKEMVASIKANTRFFQAGDEKFANEMIAKLAVPYPEPLPANASKEKKADHNAAVNEHKETVKQYIALLAQGQRIEDANNAIVALMQNKNEAIKNDAAKLQKELQPLLDFIKRLESELKAKAKLTPAEKRVTALLTRLGNARAKYEALFNKVYHDHMLAVDKALAELLDPSIKNAEAALSKAEENLDVEKAELERLKTRLETLTKSAKSKTDIHWALYEQFQYEEKQDVVATLEKDIKALRKELEELYEDRSTDFEMAAAGARAALDKHVQAQRDRVIAIEKQIAELRGEDITEVRRGVPQYPFSLQQKENELKAAKAELNQTQNKQIKTEERIKTAQEQMEESWKTTYGGTGRRRTVSNSKHDAIVRLEKDIEEARKTIEELRKKAESRKDKTLGKRDQAVFDKAEKTIDDANKERFRLLSITEEISPQNELDKKREEEQAARDRAYDAQVAKEVADLQKAQRLQEIDNAIADNLVELEAFDDLPDGETELRKLVNDEDTSTVDRNRAIAKATIINQLTSLDQQRDALQEGKPARQPKAATTESTVAQAARTAFRTGYTFEDMLKDESAATRAAAQAAKGKKAPAEAKTGTTGRKPSVKGNWDEDYSPFRTVKRTGKGLHAKRVEAIANDIIAKWQRVPEIVVVNSEEQLPKYIYEQAKRQGKLGQIPGVFDPNTTTVYLVAGNLDSAQAVALTVAHEVTGHYGLRAMLGSEYSPMMQRIFNGNKAVRELAQEKIENEGLSQDIATEEVLAELAETGGATDSALRQAIRNIFSKIKQWFADVLGIKHVSDAEVSQIVANARRFVQQAKGAEQDIDRSGAVFRTKPTYATDEMARLGMLVDKLVAPQKSANEKLRAATGGFLGLETQLIDRFAPIERLSKVMDDLKGSQMMYYLRTYDQRMNLVAQVVAHGAPAIVEIKRKDGRVERVVEAKDGANIKDVVETLKAAKPYVGNAEAVNRLFTMYLSAIRAKNKGFHTLHLGEEVTEEELSQAFKEIRANEKLANIFESARAQYNEFNRDQIKFLVQSGFMSESEGKRLIQNDDYIPFYRERNGVAEMLIGGETPIRIGSIKEMPYLQPLLGDNKRIFDFFTTSVQNTNMIVEMGLHNISTKNAVYSLADIGAAELVKKAIGNDIVKFKENGEERYARIDGVDGIPGDLIVKGMEGIPTQLPFVVKLMGIPARFLRKAITISPLYQGKQLFRDSTAAVIMSGADFMPVIGAARQIGKNSDAKRKLERRGITGGQQFTGTSEDISMILREIADGKTPLVKGLAMMEALGREADASTRRAQYNSYIEQGLSEMEATLMALESMNFTKRGASPSIHWANSLIPFVNAQIQGLNVLYKSFTGKMPFNERLKIQQKLLQRGALLATASFMYAAAMQDDEAYENATPDQKYGNFFVRIPGLDEPLRVPVPFELGYIFKAIPEAIYNTMKKDEGGKEAFDAFKQILLQTVPGGTSLGVPQAIKPALETYLGKSFYTQRDILSRREQEMLPEEQFRPNTTGFAKAMSSLFGVSPIKVDYLVNGYFGGLGLAALQAVSVPFSTGPEQATRRWSETPVVGGAFQPNDAGGIINQVYEQMQEAQKVRNTVNNMVKEGRVREAQVLVNEHANEFMLAQTADWFTKQMSQLSEYERAIKAMSATPDQKREMLDSIRQMKIQLAKTVRDVAKTTRQ